VILRESKSPRKGAFAYLPKSTGVPIASAAIGRLPLGKIAFIRMNDQADLASASCFWEDTQKPLILLY
jgi:hypothetical protein